MTPSRHAVRTPIHWAYYRRLLAGKLWLILVILEVALLLGYGWSTRQPRLFASTALLGVGPEKTGAMAQAWSHPESMHSLMQKVAQQLLLAETPPDPQGNPPSSPEELASQLQHKISIAPRRGTRLLEVTTYDSSPQRARMIAEALVHELLADPHRMAGNVPLRLVEAPAEATWPSSPNLVALMTITAILGLAFGVSCVFAMDALAGTVHGIDQAELDLGYRVLAMLPDPRLDLPLITDCAPPPQQMAAFLALRASLSPGKLPHRSILFTSAAHHEGKTFTAANTAIAFARRGLKTVVVDADPCHSRLSGVFACRMPISQQGGLHHWLTHQIPLQEYCQATEVENLEILVAGERGQAPPLCPDPEKLHALMNGLLERYDRVILDTPPVNTPHFALPLARFAEATVLVLHAGKTPARQASQALHLLERAGARIAGLVLNDFRK